MALTEDQKNGIYENAVELRFLANMIVKKINRDEVNAVIAKSIIDEIKEHCKLLSFYYGENNAA